MTDAERVVLERRRTGHPGAARAAAVALLDHDREETLAQLVVAERTHSEYLARSLPPDPARFGFSPCDFADLAAFRTLTRPPESRDLEPLAMALETPFATSNYTGCGPLQRAPALALLAFLLGDEPRAAKHLVSSRAQDPLDGFLAKVLSLLVRGRGGEIAALLESYAPRYAEAMARGLWRTHPEAFLHVRLLVALQVAAERGLIDLATLPQVIPYLPLWLISPAIAA